jgi:hypothetical protein
MVADAGTRVPAAGSFLLNLQFLDPFREKVKLKPGLCPHPPYYF